MEYYGTDRDNDLPSDEEIIRDCSRELEGDGDFRSEECVELLKEADIVVTNPPFSLFREYVAQLVEFEKKFLILGHQNAVKYNQIFPLLKNGHLWLGHNNGGDKWFQVNKNYDINTESHKRVKDGKKYFKMRNIVWFTNLPHDKRNEELILTGDFGKNPEQYPKYDNCDAFEVSRIQDLPFNCNEQMGVPITIFDKHNPSQFEILEHRGDLKINGKAIYSRIIIRRK